MSVSFKILVFLYCIHFVFAESSLLQWKSESNKPTLAMSALPFNNVHRASAGANHFAYAKDQTIHVSGYYGPKMNSSQLSTVQHAEWTKKLSTGPPIIDLCSGAHHSLMLLETGSLYSWGYNHYGQVGKGDNFPQIVEAATKVVQGEMANDMSIEKILCGGYNSAAITSDGKMFVWGYGGYGAIGNGKTEHQSKPTAALLPTETKIVASAAGYNFFVLATSTSLIFWGDNSKGAAGSSSLPALILKPTEIPALALEGESIVQMVSGQSHTLILGSKGNLFGFGSNKSFQLGLAASENGSVHGLTKLPHTGFRQIAVTLNSSFGLLKDGNIVYWGSQSWLIPNTDKTTMAPTQIDLNGYIATDFAVDSIKGNQLFLKANKRT